MVQPVLLVQSVTNALALALLPRLHVAAVNINQLLDRHHAVHALQAATAPILAVAALHVPPVQLGTLATLLHRQNVDMDSIVQQVQVLVQHAQQVTNALTQPLALQPNVWLVPMHQQDPKTA
ncbi:hypothetical protein DPMN_115105 [Dreissena polymorpha]|uniref:Secreted protein n=1 Tax=Dreissena polymorpha TaxID=45954 RepID=A0A9D4KLV2_DREPO|nr:hypothetical protein DPMN_115105 [Dreissena polymorpha]